LQKLFRRVKHHKNVAEILLQHDNALTNTSLITQEAITKVRWTVLPHPPHSPDLAPSEFHLFEALKDVIHGKRFGSNDEEIEELKKWLCVQNSNWHKKGIDAHFSRKQNC
jgi:hypothetical protein